MVYTIIAVWQTNANNLATIPVQTIVAQVSNSGLCDGKYSGLATFTNNFAFWGCGGGYDWNGPVISSGTPYISTIVINQNKSQNLSSYLNSSQPTNNTTTNSPSTYSLANDSLAIGYGAWSHITIWCILLSKWLYIGNYYL